MTVHYYLITENEDEVFLGSVDAQDSLKPNSCKNEERRIMKASDDADGLLQVDSEKMVEIGKEVYLGSHDYVSKEERHEIRFEVMEEKINNVDEKWPEKAGLEKTYL